MCQQSIAAAAKVRFSLTDNDAWIPMDSGGEVSSTSQWSLPIYHHAIPNFFWDPSPSIRACRKLTSEHCRPIRSHGPTACSGIYHESSVLTPVPGFPPWGLHKWRSAREGAQLRQSSSGFDFGFCTPSLGNVYISGFPVSPSTPCWWSKRSFYFNINRTWTQSDISKGMLYPNFCKTYSQWIAGSVVLLCTCCSERLQNPAWYNQTVFDHTFISYPSTLTWSYQESSLWRTNLKVNVSQEIAWAIP